MKAGYFKGLKVNGLESQKFRQSKGLSKVLYGMFCLRISLYEYAWSRMELWSQSETQIWTAQAVMM